MTPEEQAAWEYWNGRPGVTMSDAGPPPPAPPQAQAYYGPPPPPAMAPPQVVAPPPVVPPPQPAPAPTIGAVTGTPDYVTADFIANQKPPPPPPAMGPTPADDAALAAFTASQQQPKREPLGPVIPIGAGGGGGTGPLQKKVTDAQTAFLGTYDAEKLAKEKQGNLEGDKAAMTATRMQEQERIHGEDIAISRLREQQASEKFETQMQTMQTQLEAVKSRSINPERYYDSHSRVLTVIGSMLGGMYQGLNRLQSNPFLDDLNRKIAQDIDAQKTDIENERSAVQGKMTLLGQMRSHYKDHQLAEMQTQNLMYENAKAQITAEMAQFDAPMIKARAEEGLVVVDRAQKGLQEKIAEHMLQLKQQQLAAGAAAAKAARKEAFDQSVQLIKLGQTDRELGIKDKEADGKKGDKTQAQLQQLGKDLSDEKLVTARRTIDDLKIKIAEHGEVPGVGVWGDIKSNLGPRNILLTDEEKIGRMEWDRLALAYQVLVTGAGGSDEQMGRIKSAFAGNKSAVEQRKAIQLADEALSEAETRKRAGYDPDVVNYYDTRTRHERSGRSKPVKREPVK